MSADPQNQQGHGEGQSLEYYPDAGAAANRDNPVPDKVPNDVPIRAVGPGDRLRTIRTLIVAVVVMWVVLVGAWAVNRGLTQAAFADQERKVEEARLRLTGVEDLSSVFSEVNTAIEPSVVKIDTVRGVMRPGPDGQAIPQANSGSGVIVEFDADADVGYVMTNNHVVVNASRIAVTLFDGRTLEGRIVGTDAETDLAVLQVEAPDLIAAEWGNSDTLRKGDWVLAFGSPFGFVGSMTAGIVSALNRTQNDGIVTPLEVQALQNFIQVDAAINPGNSGGPLINVRGQIVGINTAIFTRTGDFSGIGFAIPSNQANRVYEDVRKEGRFIRGWLGVSVAPPDRVPSLAAQLGYAGNGGVIVSDIFAGTPAADSDLQRGDIILKIDDTAIRTAESLRNKTAFSRPGKLVSVEVFRDGQTLSIPIAIAAMPEDTIPAPASSFELESIGLSLTATHDGRVVIHAVAEDSPAGRVGITPGDVLLGINGERVGNPREAEALLSRGDLLSGIELIIASDRRVYRVVVRE